MENEVEQEDPEKEKRSTIYFLIAIGIIIGLVAIFLAVKHYSTPGPSYPTVTYNNFVFEKKAGMWFTTVQIGKQPYIVPLHYNPNEVKDIALIGSVDERFGNGSIYITHDPAEGNLGYVALAATELSLNIGTAFGYELIPACSKNFTDACAARPIINCENTNASVIYIIEANTTKVELRGNCVVIQGRGFELTRAADRILYSFYKVMD